MQEITFVDRVQELSLRDLAAVLFRHRKAIMAVFVLIMGTVVIGTWMAPRSYRSDAKLLLKLGRENLSIDPTIGRGGQVVTISQSRESQINSEIEIMKSRDVVELVVDQLGLEELLGRPISSAAGSSGERHEALRRFNDSLTLEVLKESNIITLSFKARTPELAQRAVEALIDVYKTSHIRAHSRRDAHEFFVGQVAQLDADLKQTEAEVRDLKNQTAIGSLPEQRSLLLQRIGQLEQEIQQNGATLTVAQTKIRTMTEMLQGLPEEVVTQRTAQSPGDTLRAKLYDLQMKEQELLSKYREESEPVREIRRQIAEAQTLLRNETPTLTQVTTQRNEANTRVREQLMGERTTVAAARSRDTVLRADLEKAKEELRRLNENEVRLAQLERLLAQQRASYEKYASSLQEADISEALERERISSISVVQPATFDATPVSPRTRLNMALGLLLGAFGGVGLAFLREFLDGTVRSRRDVEEKLRATHLTTIPLMNPRKMGRPVRELTGAREDGTPLLEQSLLRAEEVTALAPREKITAHVTQQMEDVSEDILEHLDFGSNGSMKSPCVIAVTSCHAGEGVSTVAASIAATLQMEGAGRVMLVDAKAIRRSGRGLLVLPASAISDLGNGSSEPARAYEARTNADLLAMLKRDGTCVVLDMPPVLEKGSAVRLCSVADGVVLVVKSEATRWQVAAEAKDRLMRANANLLGVVLNQRRFHVPGWLHRRL
jgi:uncharacterized protein involved in exopolysaccharide biosynthesis/Mrp family chromosome partitioning ATPase